MLGAIIGDIIGSVYEINNVKRTDFRLFSERSRFTDDSIMTLAVAKWLIEDAGHTKPALVEIMRMLGREYPTAGYGGKFREWLRTPDPEPYNSWGNGSAMRVSPVGLYAKSLPEALELAQTCAAVTHNHPEGIKGAQAIAAAVFLTKEGFTKQFIKEYITRMFGYDLERSILDIRKVYKFDVSCQGCVPEAIIAFLEGNSLEEVIRLAVSIGGDSDTIASMASAIAACRYSVPDEIEAECRKRFKNAPQLLKVADEFEAMTARRNMRHRPEFTPENISSLSPDEVFVFGSNLKGLHGGGAARVALRRFGAIMGKGVGLQGQSYAIPTMQGGVETIKPYVDDFIRFAGEHTELVFYVTRIGCGIAGYKDEDIAPMFANARKMTNVILPKSFCDIIDLRD